MTEPTKDMTLDDAANAVGQMENFFKAFRRVSDLVQFLRGAEQHKKELAADVETLETARTVALAAAKDQREDADGEFKALTKKIAKARETVKQIEDEAEHKIAEAEAKLEGVKAKAEQVYAEAVAAQSAADAKLAETLAEAELAEDRIVKAKAALAAMMAAGG